MNISDFPNYAQWLATNASQNHGALLVGMIALGGTIWLIQAKDIVRPPWLFPLIRGSAVVAFYATLVLFVFFGGQ